MSIAGAAAAAALVKNPERLVQAAKAIYKAGRWISRHVKPDKAAPLWQELRDSLDLEPGTATAAGLTDMPGEDEMREADDLVNGGRQSDYGSPSDNWGGVAKVWSGILSRKLKVDITAEEASLMMVGLKVQRQAMQPKRDNIVDAHGYLLVSSHIRAAKEANSESR
jgi:hypothetical protein